jgi:polysaccharide chain length determinant protein (PEP-CTERM system associated)
MERPVSDSKKNILLWELADSVLLSWWTITAALCFGLAAGLLALHFIPKVYSAKTTILVDVQKLPKEYVAPSTVANETEVRLGTFWDAVMMAPELDLIAREAFGAETNSELNAAVGQIRSNVNVTFLRRSQTLEIEFRDSQPERAASVANGLSDVIVGEYKRYRAERASEATRTLERLTAAAEAEWKAKQQEIAEYRRRFPHQTAGQISANEERLDEARQRLNENLAAQRDAAERIRAFEAQAELDDTLVQLDDSAPSTTSGSVADQGRIATLRRELKDLRTRYSDNHPAVRAKVREIEDLERRSAEEPVPWISEPSVPSSSPTASIWEIQIGAERRAIEKLKAEERSLRNDIAVYTQRVDAAPDVSQRLSDLSKDLTVLENKYFTWKSKLETAETAQLLEEDQQGAQFEIIDPAVAPGVPSWPKPLPVLGAALAVGFVLFVGPIPTRRLFRPVIRSEAALRRISTVPFLVSIPPFQTPSRARISRRRRVKNVGLSTISVLFLAAVVVLLQRL